MLLGWRFRGRIVIMSAKTKGHLSRQWWAICVPVILLPIVLFPVVHLLIVSVQGSSSPLWGAYTDVFTDPIFWQSVAVTYRLALISTTIAAALGLIISIALYFSQLKSAGIFMRGIELVVAFPSFLIAFALIYLYGSQGA